MGWPGSQDDVLASSISDPAEGNSLGLLNYAKLEGEALSGVEPWAMVHKAMNGANHDYVYNHPPDFTLFVPGFNRGAYADLMFASGPLDWDGAINLWQFMDYAVKHGGTIDFAGNQQKTEATVNAIIKKTGINPEIVWSFYTNLDRMSRQSGNATIVNPSLSHDQSDKPDTELWPWILGGVVVMGFIVYVLHET